jgi:hypothetical protein
VNVKYKTKNNKTDDNPVFLAIKNHINANISSNRNFELMDTRLYIVWLAGSFDCPLKNIDRVRIASRKNTADTIPIS